MRTWERAKWICVREKLFATTPKDSKNFVETAAFGCPAAPAAVFSLAPKVKAQRMDISSREGTAFGALQAEIVALRATDSRRRLSPQNQAYDELL
ncbi:MAG: hypothetical protein DMG78_24470 [Acidobacteria bacterium]|nr:MAG: hypothetical protein DMG78_24470 [Acidobacteriota bacterium]